MNPHETIQAMYEAGDFWMNKIRREGRNSNNTVLKDWCDSLKTFFEELIQFVKTNFKNGIEWNENGITVAEYLSNPDYHHHMDKAATTSAATTTTVKPVIPPSPEKVSFPKSTPAVPTINGVYIYIIYYYL